METPVKHYILVSPANMKFMLANVTEEEREMIREYVDKGKGNQLLPFHGLGAHGRMHSLEMALAQPA